MSGLVHHGNRIALGLKSVRLDHDAPRPVCRVHRTTALSIAHATVTAITWTAVQAETTAGLDSAWASGTPTRLTARLDGWYRLMAGAGLDPSAGGARRQAAIRLNGTTQLATLEHPSFSASYFPLWALGCDYPLTAGDYVELALYQDAGVALNTRTDAPIFLSLAWLGHR